MADAEYADMYLGAYYEALNAHAPFRESFAALEQALRRMDEGVGRPTLLGSESWNTEEWPLDARHAICLFAERWRLPARSLDDVRHVLAMPRSVNDGDARPEIAILIRARALWINPTFVSAPAPEPFEYDAELHEPGRARGQAKQRADAAYAEMLRQIEAVEEAAKRTGRRPRHPRHLPQKDHKTGQMQTSDDLRTGALRFLRRFALGWSWQQIARAEYLELHQTDASEELEDSDIREHVGRWVDALGEPLGDA